MSVTPFVTALLASAEGGGPSITNVDFVLYAGTLVLFGLFAWVLGKFGWGPLLQAVEAREKSVRDGVEGAKAANAEAHALLEKHKEMLRDASREREEILKRALGEAETVKNDVISKARAESEAILVRAKEQIEREKTVAILELRGQVVELAMDAASRIVKSSLTPAAQRELVDQFISSLPKAN
jgi:F-type H+-transporting ATPase subunit b